MHIQKDLAAVLFHSVSRFGFMEKFCSKEIRKSRIKKSDFLTLKFFERRMTILILRKGAAA